MTEFSVIGKGVVRKDAVEKVTGKAVFAADVKPVGMIYGRMLGSPYAHAIIKSIDTTEAEALPGVKAVITGKDVPETRTGYIMDRHILCKKIVRYVGDPVAAVAATTPAIAEKACELIKVEYEELPAVFDPLEAIKSDCPVVLHQNIPAYGRKPVPLLMYRFEPDMPNVFLHRKIRHGDIEKGFEEADYIYEGTYTLPRAQHCPMEPHACVVEPNVNGGITIWASEQGGVRLKYFICDTFGFDTSKVRFITPYVGGGFGGKVDLMVTPIAVMLAMKSGKAVRLEMSREEVFIHGNPRSPAVVKIKDGIKKDGTLVAREIYEVINGGAYSGHVAVLVNDGAFGATGTYRVPNMKLDAYGVYTNTPATGPYRALGAELLMFAIECQMDRMAEKFGIDRLEIRMKNVLENGDIDANGQMTRNNETKAALKKAAEYLNWDKEPEKLPAPWVVGRGISCGNKYTCSDTTSTMIAKAHDDGTIELRHYQIEMGQGCNTVLAQIAAEQFGISTDKVKIVFDDSDYCPFDHGTFCSRGTFMNGNSALLALKNIKQQIFERASEIMSLPVDKLDTRDSKVFEKDNPDNFITFKQLFNNGGWVPNKGEIIGTAAYTYRKGIMDYETGQGEPVAYYSYGALAMEVAINPETGEIRFLKSGGWFDAGQILNEKTIAGQIEGAIVMGIGQACFEETLFNDKGKIINGSYRDYKIPTMLDVPFNDNMAFGFVGKPNEEGPYGAKGIGEVALVPVMPAVANAINNALGVKLNDIPLTKEKLFMALQDNKK